MEKYHLSIKKVVQRSPKIKSLGTVRVLLQLICIAELSEIINIQ